MSFYEDKLRLAANRASIEFDREITVRDLKGKSRFADDAEPRFFCVAYLEATGRYSQTVLGKMFDRDSTTILHALRRAHGHDGKLIHKHAPLWTKEHFRNMIIRDGLRPKRDLQLVESVNLEQLLAIGSSNLREAVSEIAPKWPHSSCVGEAA